MSALVPPPGTPLPNVDEPDFAPFWAGCRLGRLLLPRCAEGHLNWPPRPVCRTCRADITDWTQVPGRGRLFSWTVVHRTRLRGYADLTPYTVVIVALDQDPAIRLLGRCVRPPARPAQGMPMETEYVPAAEGVVLPFWRPAAESAPGAGEPASAEPPAPAGEPAPAAPPARTDH
ncbi:Zn-ribbon domain-containing OB-fold protein [Actinacidiphila sp. ITFR-21]|uniref:Zn-ribbon domain-containing OB-fold protein n=1 Tax=Actinacidiphila sp. ITFR-21 TaxID=3075199 RepID=UPI00288B6861|nr:OB-fold domain-containing protein [Streptomyces sp. ITFR-21]WNI19011.1 OB-fold domain-containing protein [Streptomyces sp. ITFR-21]